MVNRGSWRHLGEVLLVQPYDGITPATDVRFDFIALWVRLFDFPELMMTEEYGRSLGGRLGEVLEFGSAVRVRVNFPLAKLSKASFMIWI